jgi:hypothetical protein
MRRSASAVLAFTLLLGAACADRGRPPMPPDENLDPWAAEEANLAGRFESAVAAGNVNTRDEILGQLARDAAKAGHPGIVRKALSQMTDPAARDDTAAGCAAALVQAGYQAEAREMARKIRDTASRERTLKRMAVRSGSGRLVAESGRTSTATDKPSKP